MRKLLRDNEGSDETPDAEEPKPTSPEPGKLLKADSREQVAVVAALMRSTKK